MTMLALHDLPILTDFNTTKIMNSINGIQLIPFINTYILGINPINHLILERFRRDQ